MTIKHGSLVRVAGKNYLDMAGVAEKLGVQVNTVRVYHKRTQRNLRAGTVKPWDFPQPDEVFGRSPVWREATIERWMKKRPRPGAHARATDGDEAGEK